MMYDNTWGGALELGPTSDGYQEWRVWSVSSLYPATSAVPEAYTMTFPILLFLLPR